MFEIGILVLGILIYSIGRKSYYKFEEKNKENNNNSGVLLQLNTILLCIGFTFIITSILSFFFNN